jgi:hypothetical protein
MYVLYVIESSTMGCTISTSSTNPTTSDIIPAAAAADGVDGAATPSVRPVLASPRENNSSDHTSGDVPTNAAVATSLTSSSDEQQHQRQQQRQRRQQAAAANIILRDLLLECTPLPLSMVDIIIMYYPRQQMIIIAPGTCSPNGMPHASYIYVLILPNPDDLPQPTSSQPSSTSLLLPRQPPLAFSDEEQYRSPWVTHASGETLAMAGSEVLVKDAAAMVSNRWYRTRSLTPQTWMTRRRGEYVPLLSLGLKNDTLIAIGMYVGCL